MANSLLDANAAQLPSCTSSFRPQRGIVALLRGLGRVLPTAGVLSGLAALAMWGHHSGWTLPSYASLTGQTATTPADWCADHGVPESVCVECNSQLLPYPKTPGWCRQHGIHECPLDYPQVAQLGTVPQVKASDLEQAQRGLTFAPRPKNSKKCSLHKRRIQFASAEAFDKAGIDVWPATTAPMEETVTASGEITYDPTRVITLSTPVPGRVWRMDKEIGQTVRQGEVVALVDAAEVGRAKAEFLQALTQVELKSKIVERLRPLAGRAVATAQFQEAETALHAARIRLLGAEQTLVNLGLPLRSDDVKGLDLEALSRRLQFLGLPETLSRSLDPRTTTNNLVPIRAALEGVVIGRSASVGEMVDATRNLLVVADTRHMWLTLDVRLEDARFVHLGQPVRFRPDGQGAEVHGPLCWISTEVDTKTRTVKVRAHLGNAEGRLRDHTFGTGTVLLRSEKNAVVVPNEAVHWDGSCHIVFVRDRDYLRPDAPKVFHVRSVRPGVKDEKNTEIIVGVLPNEAVASRNSGILLAELRKNSLGDG